MSRTRGPHYARFAYHGLDRRTVAEIQRNVTKKCNRNIFSRLLHASSDKDTIGAWKKRLDEFLRIFEVRPADSTRSSLIISSQTELAVNTNVTVSGMRRDMSKVHDDVSKIREKIDGSVRPVNVSPSNPRTTKGCLRLPRSKPGQQLRLLESPVPYTSI